jgi:hypothetical protein
MELGGAGLLAATPMMAAHSWRPAGGPGTQLADRWRVPLKTRDAGGPT